MTTNSRYRIRVYITDETPAIEHDLKALYLLYRKLIELGKSKAEVVKIFMASFDMTRNEAEILIDKMIYKETILITEVEDPLANARSGEDRVIDAKPTQSFDGPK